MTVQTKPRTDYDSVQALISKIKQDTEKKHGKTVDQLREEREKRINDAMTLQMPDRVPVNIQTGVFAAKYGGVPLSTMYYDYPAYLEACLKTVADFEPDSGGGVLPGTSGLVNELLGIKTQRWPGGNLPEDVPYQFVEGEYMKMEEYDLFLSDPSDFVFRYFLPRTYGLLEPLAKLPPFRDMIGGFGLAGLLRFFLMPEYRQIGEKMVEAAKEQERLREESARYGDATAQIGFPASYSRGMFGAGISAAPFDNISDFLRGMRGTILDMYRCPDKLLAACDLILEWRIAQAVPTKPDAHGRRPRMFMPLHRGSDGFMSLKQFEKFYWPGLKKAILKNIELGYLAMPFFEGAWDDRLEYLLDLPKGKVIFWCEKTDIFRAKQILGNHMCIQGGVPPAMLTAGSPSEVEEYCKKLIKEVGKGGGFILGCGSAMDVAKPENVRAMINAAKKYGGY